MTAYANIWPTSNRAITGYIFLETSCQQIQDREKCSSQNIMMSTHLIILKEAERIIKCSRMTLSAIEQVCTICQHITHKVALSDNKSGYHCSIRTGLV